MRHPLFDMSNNRPKEIEDIDDDFFVSSKPKNENYIFAQKAEEISKRTAGSIKNSMKMIIQSEETGVSTLETLAEQGEQLRRVDNDLDNINAITRATQKHLNSMRSFFGGMFSKKDTRATPIPKPATIPKSATISDFKAPSRPSFSERESPRGLTQSLSKPANVEEEIDDGLDQLGDGLSRLKHLASKLGDEITSQNGLLEQIEVKSTRANDSIQHQNRQINQILKK